VCAVVVEDMSCCSEQIKITKYASLIYKNDGTFDGRKNKPAIRNKELL
jgi:hypothetical protein